MVFPQNKQWTRSWQRKTRRVLPSTIGSRRALFIACNRVSRQYSLQRIITTSCESSSVISWSKHQIPLLLSLTNWTTILFVYREIRQLNRACNKQSYNKCCTIDSSSTIDGWSPFKEGHLNIILFNYTRRLQISKKQKSIWLVRIDSQKPSRDSLHSAGVIHLNGTGIDLST